MLPGLPFAMVGGKELAYVNAAYTTTNSSSLSLPSGWAVGDVCFVLSWQNTSLPTLTSGYTNLGTLSFTVGSGATWTFRASYRVLESGDTVYTGHSAGTLAAVYRPVGSVSSVALGELIYSNPATGNPISDLVIDANSVSGDFIFLVGATKNTSNANSSWSPTGQEFLNGATQAVSWRGVATNDINLEKTYSDSSTNGSGNLAGVGFSWLVNLT